MSKSYTNLLIYTIINVRTYVFHFGDLFTLSVADN